MKSAILVGSFALAAAQDLFLESRQVNINEPQTMTSLDAFQTPDELKAMKFLQAMDIELGGAPSPNIGCIIKHCLPEVASCAFHSIFGESCMKTLKCNLACTKTDDGHNRAPGCAYLCEMTSGYTSPHYVKMIECLGERNQCLPTYPDDGDCLAQDSDALQNLTSLDQVEGDWWVVKGINCGQVTDGTPFKPSGKSVPSLNPTKGRNFPGGYDWYPCQHERFVKSNGHDFPNPTTPWVNNITYCGGANGGLSNCTTSIIDTVANVTMCAPGVVCHNYTDAPLKPQFEHWRIISMPHPDWIASIWCGGTPLVTYNGGIALGRNKRNMDEMPQWVADNFKAAYKKHGVEWDQMCPSSNEGCP